VELSDEMRARVQALSFWHLATLSRDGSPHVTPRWVGLVGVEPSRPGILPES